CYELAVRAAGFSAPAISARRAILPTASCRRSLRLASEPPFQSRLLARRIAPYPALSFRCRSPRLPRSSEASEVLRLHNDTIAVQRLSGQSGAFAITR